MLSMFSMGRGRAELCMECALQPLVQYKVGGETRERSVLLRSPSAALEKKQERVMEWNRTNATVNTQELSPS